MRWQRMAAWAVSFSLTTAAFATYNIQDRFELINDRFSTDEMLNPPGHDFLLELNAAASPKLKKMVDDGKKVSKDGTEDEKTAKANAFLNKYVDSEQSVKIGTQLGVPLPTFYLGKLKIVPDIRLHARGLVHFDITSQPLTGETVLEFVDESKIKDKIGDENLSNKVLDLIKEKYEDLREYDSVLDVFNAYFDAGHEKHPEAVDLFDSVEFSVPDIEKVKDKIAGTEDAKKWKIPTLDTDPVLTA